MADGHEGEGLRTLLDRLAAGDEAAADLLIERSMRQLQKRASSMLDGSPRLRRWYETGDVLQAAALRLHRALKESRPPTPADYFRLAAVQVRRELCDLARHEFGPEGPGAHHATAPPGQGEDGVPAGAEAAAQGGGGPATQAGWRDLLRHVQDSLPQEEREVFDLHFLQGLQQEEVAEVLGVSVPTVKRRWRSARLLLDQAGLLGTRDG